MIPCSAALRSVVAGVHADWSAAFAVRDVSRLVELYAADTQFYGSAAELCCGSDGVRRYFTSLSPRFRRAHFASPAVSVPAPGVICASGSVVFEVEEAGSTRRLPYRITHVLVERDGKWLIAAHHASQAPE